MLKKLIDKCKEIDIEYLVAIEKDKILSLDGEICNDSYVKVTRLVRGG